MKKLYLITILLAMLMSMPMYAYDFEQDGIYYNIEGDHVSVTYSGEGVYQGSVTIPSQVTYNDVTYPVTAIGEYAFEGGEGITSLKIPSSITSIGEYAFRDCGSNINVYISDIRAWCKVTFGNEHSSPLSSAKKFYLSSSEVKQLVIPNGVESIPNYAFYQCRSITSLYISGSVKSIGSSAFEDCTGLKSVYLLEGVVSIGGSSFEGCTSLSTILFPTSLTSIAINAFRNCTNLNTIASRIEDPFAFDENVFSTYSTATVIVPEGTTIAYQSTDGWNLFDNITDDSSQDPTKRTIHVATAGTLSNFISSNEKYQIVDLTLTGELNGTDFRLIRDMAGATWIDRYDHCFFKNTDGILTSIDLADAKIVKGGLSYLEITDVSPARSLSRSGADYIYHTENNSISSRLFYATKINSIVIPNSVTSIDSHAFTDSDLASIIIPDGVNSISGNAFSSCNSLTSITVESGNQYYDSRNNSNAIIGKTNNTLIVGCRNTIIPNGITSIGENAFEGCKGLTSVTIPNSVESIGNSAFSDCSGLTSLTIPNSVTSIGNYAFSGCSGLTIVTIPNNVTSIGNYTFRLCSALTSVTIPNSVTSIGIQVFYGCSGLTSVTIPNSVTSIGDASFYGCSSLTYVTIPNSVTSIGGSAFYGCKGLTSVTIPNSVASIGSSAFSGCSGLSSATIPNSVTSIGYRTFSRCNGLTSVTIPNSVTSIGGSAFYGCSGLTSVTIGNSVTSIGYDAFSECSGLTSILSLNDTPPTCDGTYVFDNVVKENCVLWVPKGSVAAYMEANEWKDFQNIKEIVDGDVNLDEKVNRNDQGALVTHIMGEKPEGFFEGLADLNGDDDVNAADVVKLVDILNNGGLSTVTEFSYDNIDGSLVVSSLTCTLNNKRDEAILLTRCELYSNGSLFRSKSFANDPVSVAAGGNKSCTFENLSKPANSTDFTVCWHYTVNGESFVYRCPLTD